MKTLVLERHFKSLLESAWINGSRREPCPTWGETCPVNCRLKNFSFEIKILLQNGLGRPSHLVRKQD